MKSAKLLSFRSLCSRFPLEWIVQDCFTVLSLFFIWYFYVFVCNFFLNLELFNILAVFLLFFGPLMCGAFFDRGHFKVPYKSNKLKTNSNEIVFFVFSLLHEREP